VVARDGTPINMLVTTAPILDEQGNISAVMEMSANITQIKELENRLTSLGILIGSVSHGLKGLLNGLAGGMYLVETGFKKEDQQRVHKGWTTVKRNVSRIQSMVSDILYYAKDRVPNWESHSAEEIVEEVCNLAETRAKENNVQLIRGFDPNTGELEADDQAIRALLTNLIENSVDACRMDNGKDVHCVTVRLSGSVDHIQYEVQDNGIGMDQETREKALSMFFSSKGMEGTGLGLFVSDRIAKAHGGNIELESQSGVGSRFVVKLPRTRPPEPDPSEKEAVDD